MPKLESEQRISIDARLAIHERIRHSFDSNQWTSQHCYLCQWASNGRTLDKAIAANKRHIAKKHAVEEAEMRETEIPMSELRDSLHDHDCVRAACICKCGCTDGPFCTLVFGPLCSVCQVRDMRGDHEHGIPTEGKE